jgi:hypothetical protein
VKILLTLAFLLLGSQPLLAQNKWIEAPAAGQLPQVSASNNGEWILGDGSQHRFSGNLRISAATTQGEENLGVICEYDGEPIVAFALGYSINPNRFAQDMKFKVQFRADQNPVLVAAGMAVAPNMLWVLPKSEMIKQLMKAKEVKFLAENIDQTSLIAFDWAFKTNNAAEVIARLLKACNQPAATR